MRFLPHIEMLRLINNNDERVDVDETFSIVGIVFWLWALAKNIFLYWFHFLLNRMFTDLNLNFELIWTYLGENFVHKMWSCGNQSTLFSRASIRDCKLCFPIILHQIWSSYHVFNTSSWIQNRKFYIHRVFAELLAHSSGTTGASRLACSSLFSSNNTSKWD